MPKVKPEVRWDQQISNNNKNENLILLTFKFNQLRVLPEVDIIDTTTFSKLLVTSHTKSQYDITLEIELFDKVKTFGYITEKTLDGFHLILHKNTAILWPRLTKAKKMPVDYHLIYGNQGNSLSHFQHLQQPTTLPQVGCKKCAERASKFPLLSLPSHILIRVIKHVDEKNILPLSRASRLLNSLCDPIIWHNFTIPIIRYDQEVYKKTRRIVEVDRLLKFLTSEKARKYIKSFVTNNDNPRTLNWCRGRLQIPSKGFHTFVNAQIDALVDISKAVSELPNLISLKLDMRMEISPGYRVGLTNTDYFKLNRKTMAEDTLQSIPTSSSIGELSIECSQFLTFSSIFQDISKLSSVEQLNVKTLGEMMPNLDKLTFTYVGRTIEDDELYYDYWKAFSDLKCNELVMRYYPQIPDSKVFDYKVDGGVERVYLRNVAGKFRLFTTVSTNYSVTTFPM
ncbi:hypothetical protein E3Q05_03277 [Wallemia mellicola]|nr:hypothetical protein E3Q05_03277 [Wallemia mellicola]